MDSGYTLATNDKDVPMSRRPKRPRNTRGPKRPMFKLSFNYSGGGFDPSCREVPELMTEQLDGTLCPCTSANAPSNALSSSLDERPPQIPIDATPITSGEDWETVEEAMRAAAEEVRFMAKEYYSNYEELRLAGRDGILPEAGARIILKGNGRVTYYGVYPGWARSSTDAEVHYPDGSGKLVGRLHFHWINSTPSSQDLFAAESIAVGLPRNRRQLFEAWVASYETEKPYFIARDELKED